MDKKRFGNATNEKSILGALMDFLIEIIKFFVKRKRFWLIPIFVLLVIFGGLIILSQGSAVAPFIYTLF